MGEFREMKKEDLILRDYLALDRTALANRRTLLSYIRTALGFFGTGVAGVKLISDWPAIYHLCVILMFLSPIVLVVGFVQFILYARRYNAISSHAPAPNKKDSAPTK